MLAQVVNQDITLTGLTVSLVILAANHATKEFAHALQESILKITSVKTVIQHVLLAHQIIVAVAV